MQEKISEENIEPFDVVAQKRIAELLAAICRQMNTNELTREKIAQAKLYAIELNEQLDLLSTLMLYR